MFVERAKRGFLIGFKWTTSATFQYFIYFGQSQVAQLSRKKTFGQNLNAQNFPDFTLLRVKHTLHGRYVLATRSRCPKFMAHNWPIAVLKHTTDEVLQYGTPGRSKGKMFFEELLSF